VPNVSGEEQSSELVVHAARLVRAIRRRVGHPAGIRILAILDERGPLGVTELASVDRSSQPTVSGAVHQLEEQGLVARARPRRRPPVGRPSHRRGRGSRGPAPGRRDREPVTGRVPETALGSFVP